MADKKLNEVPVVSDIVSIFGKRSNGEIVQIDKSNLATLLGGLMNNLKLYPFMDRGMIIDANNVILAGMYKTDKTASNIPVIDWTVLSVFVSDIYIVQYIYALNQRKLYIRNSNDKGKNWSSWKQIATE